jgi:hypothetical protein
MVAHNTPALNLKVFKLSICRFFYHFSGVNCVYTVQFSAVFDRCEMRPKVVLTARWRHRANLKSPIDSQTTISFQCFCDTYRLSHVLTDFHRSKLRPDVVLTARWCQRHTFMSPFDSAASVFYRWSFDGFRLSCTVKRVFDRLLLVKSTMKPGGTSIRTTVFRIVNLSRK